MTTLKQIHWLDRPIQNRVYFAVCRTGASLISRKLKHCSCRSCPYYTKCSYRIERRSDPQRTNTKQGEG